MLITMSIIAFVLLVATLIISVSSYHNKKSEVYDELERGIKLVEDDRKDSDIIPIIPQDDFGKESRGKFNPEQDMLNMYLFAVLIDNNCNIIKEFNTDNIDETVLNNAIISANDLNKEKGELAEYNLIYIKRVTPEGVAISFTSSEVLHSNLSKTLFVSITSYFGILLILTIVNFFISNIALKPVSEAWEKQKQFIQDASHDLKTPLTVILANNNILLTHQEETVEKQKDWINSTLEEATHMKALIDAMLESAKTENMKNNLVLSELNLSDITMSLVLQYEPIAFEKEIIIDSDIDSNVICQSNETSFHRLLSILVDNAIKYGKKNSSIKLSLKNNKKNYVLKINNQGDIIPNEDINHIFERFYRSEKARNSEGYGLGLAIAKNLAEALNGKISCESNIDDGTTFTVIFKKL